LCENRINAFDESVATGQEMSQVDIMTAIQFTADAWARVQQSTITRSWNKTGILPRNLPDVQCNENDEQTIQHLIDCLQVEEPMSAKEYLEVDDHLLGETERIPTDEDVIEIVTGIETPEPCEEYEDKSPVSLALANESIDNILRFIRQEYATKFDINHRLVVDLRELHRMIKVLEIQGKRQLHIDSFFAPQSETT
jgi:hypothetical protein